MRQEATSFPAMFINRAQKINGGSEQPGNKAGKGDTTAVTTWAEKLLLGLRNTVVTTWASPSKN